MSFEHLQTDVLIVGGGGAATAAAIAAHQAGARTMLAVKGQFGIPGVRGAGATSNPVGDFWTIRTIGPKGGFFNPPEAVLADMIQTGLGMANPELCEIFVSEAPEAISRLKSMGMKFQSRMLATMPAHQDNKTNNIVAIQKSIIESTNTQVLQNANLVDLIIEQDHCRGAIGLYDDGNRFVVQASAVILATGGVGQLFRHSFNPPGNTGDGYAMALRAGAQLTNMEFMQQGLATTWPAQGIVMLYEMEEPYRLLNKHGKAFLKDYLPADADLTEVCRTKSSHWPVSCRDLSIHIDRAIKQEALRHGNPENREYAPVFLDMSRAERKFMPELFPHFMREKGIDISCDLLQVQNHHHTSNGGIIIDRNGESSISGLYAIGEASAWQGADRLGGTMLGGSQVFGWRAGTAAGKRAIESEMTPLSSALATDLFDQYAPDTTSSNNCSLMSLHKELQDRMWEHLIVEKDEPSLMQAKYTLDELSDRLRNQSHIKTPFDKVTFVELTNMITVARIITESALLRTESRGSHYRRDFPVRDDSNWLSNIIISLENNKIVLEKRWLAEQYGWQDAVGDVRISPWG